jgi:polysaccharide pyruvyl transferase WcaK-like protein
MIYILIPEETPSLNKGEAGILSGMLESFKLLDDDVHVTMFSIYPEDDEPRYNSQAEIIDARGVMPSDMISGSSHVIKKMFELGIILLKHLSFAFLHLVLRDHALKVMRRKTWASYSKADMVIICHDSLFYPLYHPMVALFCKVLGKKVVIYGSTFNLDVKKGQFRGLRQRIAKWAVNLVLKNVDLITLREELSHELIRGISVDSVPTHLTGDFPFLLRPAGEERVQEILRAESLEGYTRMVGLSIGQHKLGVTFPQITNIEIKYGRFIEIIAEVVNYLTDSLEAAVVFIPHCIGHGQKLDDRIPSTEIYRKTQNKDRVRVITQEYSPEDLKGLAGRFDIFVGMRLHAVVDALCMGVPSIMLTHPKDNRAHGILGRMMELNPWLYDLIGLTASSLIERTNSLWNSREHLRADLELKVRKAKEQTMHNGNLLAELLKQRKKL